MNNQQVSYGSLFSGVGLIVGILLIFNCFVIVDSGHVGVVKRLGAVQSVALAEGFHFKIPFVDSIEKIDIRLTGAEARAASASKDLQTVQTEVSLQFALNGDFAAKAFQGIGRSVVVAKTVIEPAIQESVKAITAQYTAEQLVTQRAEVKLQIQDAIGKYIDVTLHEKKLEGAIRIANVAITDFSFSDEFNRAIEMKVKAEQEALQAKNEKIRRVTQAEAAAAEKKLAADASAYEIEASSKARADAIAREAKALKDNPQLIKLRAIEKWNGELPRFSGNHAVPFIDVADMAAK